MGVQELTFNVNTVNMPVVLLKSTGNTPNERDTRDRILDAAEAIIREEGLRALSLRAIARRIDLTAPAAYRYFSGKEAILEAVIQRGYLKFIEGLEQARQGLAEPQDLLRVSLRYYLDYWVRDPASFFLMMELNRDFRFLSKASIQQGSFGDLPQLFVRCLEENKKSGGSRGSKEGRESQSGDIAPLVQFFIASLQGIAMALVAETQAGVLSAEQSNVSIGHAVDYLCTAVNACSAVKY